jgi:hypothetical protein
LWCPSTARSPKKATAATFQTQTAPAGQPKAGLEKQPSFGGGKRKPWRGGKERAAAPQNRVLVALTVFFVEPACLDKQLFKQEKTIVHKSD